MGTLLLAIILGYFGTYSPENRGSFINILLLFFVLLSFVNGYYSTWLYSSFGGKHIKWSIRLSGTLVPSIIAFVSSSIGILFILYLIQNTVATSYHSITAISPISLITLLLIWLCLAFPLLLLGSSLGLKREPYAVPIATSAIPREIPPQPWYLRNLPLMLIGGVVPFGVVFVELFFFISSLWMGQGYSLYRFIFITLILLIIVTAEIAIVIIFSILCSENYNWWWISFIAPGFSGIYVFAFAFYYLSVLVRLDNVLVIVEIVGYLLIFSILFSILTGTIGFISSFFFIDKLFGSVKVD